MSLRTGPLALILTLAVTPALSAQYQAAGKVTWNYDETTTGSNVSWTSPSSVEPNASEFNTTNTIDAIEVGWQFLFLTGTLDVTDQIPPELLVTSGGIAGPAPISLVSDSLVFPDPPEAPAVAADVDVGLNAAGFGTFTATNVTLGTTPVDTGILGVVDVTITSIRVRGTLTMHSTWFTLPGALAGAAGEPVLSATGSLEPLSTGSVELTNAAPNETAFLVLSTTLLSAPFKGGFLIPFPEVFFGVPTDGTGAASLPFAWPAGIPSRAPLFMQYWIPDAGGPKGFAASNAVSALTP
jgi:hypothetical protein